ncbi:MAG TPA: phosphate ABC transporter permease subunit PstC [Opitutaceae bacterium]
MLTTTANSKTSFPIHRTKTRFFGLTSDECVQAFFGGNALVAVIVLGLITIFLFREGLDFFHEDRIDNLTVYRKAGLEFVDFAKQEERDHTALTRYIAAIRMKSLEELTANQHLTLAQANERLAPFDAFADKYGDAIDPVRSILSDWTDLATALKTRYGVAEESQQSGKVDTSAAAAKIAQIDPSTELKPLLDGRSGFHRANEQVAKNLHEVVQQLPVVPTPALQAKMTRLVSLTEQFVGVFPDVEQKLATWDYMKPVPFYAAFTSFLFGREWLTASFWQDWYGIVPLFVGSLMVSVVALMIAVPLGVASAVYVSQIAKPSEKRFVKPMIEFISAFPSVVLGFFGVVVLGEFIRNVSHASWLSWLPGFPIAERLNVLTAGCLLALIAVPTIFTLAEDAIHNVPRSFKEASYALGGGRFQTIVRITVPASLSGIISAVLLGFGRVIGETMVVLLCAGNRIAIPDFTQGLGVFTQPVHTMTGIIAQEMGEVVRNSLHYRALFMVGIVLFFLSLLINYLAQKIVHRYRLPIA